MKRFIFPCLLLLQASCLPVSVDSDLSACPAEGRAGLAFFAGKPPDGTAIPPETAEGATTWSFAKNADIYVVCRYADGYERVQRLPQQARSCTVSGTGAASCKASL